MFSQNKVTKIIDVISYIFLAINILVVPFFLDRHLGNSYIIPKQYVFGGLIMITALVWLAKFVLTKKFQFASSALDKAILATGAIALVSAIFSVNIYDSFFGRSEYFSLNFISLILYFAFYYLLINFIRTEKKWRGIYDLLVFSGFVSFVIFITKSFFKINILDTFLGASWNTVDNINSIFGIWAIVILILTFGQLIKKDLKIFRTVAYFITGVLSLAVLLMLSFKVLWWMLLFSMVLLLLLGISFIKEIRLGWLSVLFFVLVMSAVFIFLGTPKFVQVNVPTEVALGFKSSWNIVQSTMFTSIKSFLVGSGLGSFGVDFSQFRDVSFNSDSVAWSLRFNQPYNTFFSLIAEGGIFFGITFIFLFLLAIGHVFNIWKKMRVNSFLKEEAVFTNETVLFESFLMAVVLIVLSIGAFVSFYGQVLWWVWWLVLALVMRGFSFYYRNFIHEKEFAMEDTPQYSLSFSFGLIVAMTALVMVSVFGIQLYTAEIDYAKASASGDYKKAEGYINSALEKRPNSDIYHAALAQIYLNEAVALSNNTTPDVQSISSLMAKAVNEAKSATDISPQSVALWENLATMYENASSLVPQARDWAIKSLQQAQVLEPTNPTSYWRLGNSYGALAKWDDAVKNYQKAIDLKPDYYSAYIGLSSAYEQTQKPAQAIEVYEQLISKNQLSPELLFNYGRLIYNRNGNGDRDLAEKVWKKVLESQPNYSNVLYSLGLLYETRGNKALALQYYYKVRDLNPNNKDILTKIQSLVGVSAPAPATTPVK